MTRMIGDPSPPNVRRRGPMGPMEVAAARRQRQLDAVYRPRELRRWTETPLDAGDDDGDDAA